MAKKRTSTEAGQKRNRSTKPAPSSRKATPSPTSGRAAKAGEVEPPAPKATSKCASTVRKKPTTATSKSTRHKASTTGKADKATKTSARSTRKQAPAPKAKNNDGHLPKVAAKQPKILRPRKTHLKPDELAEFRQLLISKRRELVGDVTHLESEAMREGSAGAGRTSSSMPIHMADLGSDTWEQELTLGLIENERGLLCEIDEALDRIEAKTYGICMATNRTISKSRLRARPWAKYCIEYARKRELGLV